MGRVKRDLRLDGDAYLGHRGCESCLTESGKVGFALSRVQVVVVLTFPPRDVRQTADGCLVQPASD
jgi:hypothetical protein